MNLIDNGCIETGHSREVSHSFITDDLKFLFGAWKMPIMERLCSSFRVSIYTS